MSKLEALWEKKVICAIEFSVPRGWPEIVILSYMHADN